MPAQRRGAACPASLPCARFRAALQPVNSAPTIFRPEPTFASGAWYYERKEPRVQQSMRALARVMNVPAGYNAKMAWTVGLQTGDQLKAVKKHIRRKVLPVRRARRQAKDAEQLVRVAASAALQVGASAR